MTRKKISDTDSNAAIIAELDTDEEFIVDTNTTKRVRREKRAATVEAEPEAVDLDDDAIDAEVIEPFSPTSLAALIYAEDDQPNFAEDFCTVHVRRNPDAMGDDFATPCSTVTTLPRLVNIELTADRADVEDRVRRDYGGGHYYFQIRSGAGLGRSWKATLSDLPSHLRDTPKAEPEAVTPTANHAENANPMAAMLESMRMQKEMRSLLIGDEIDRLIRENADLREKIEKAYNSAPPQSDTAILLKLMQDAKGEPTVTEFVRDILLPETEPEGKKSLWDFAQYAIENGDKVAGFIGSFLSGLSGQPAAQSPNVLQMLKAQPPQAMPTPEPSRVRRKKAEPETTASEDAKNAE